MTRYGFIVAIAVLGLVSGSCHESSPPMAEPDHLIGLEGDDGALQESPALESQKGLDGDGAMAQPMGIFDGPCNDSLDNDGDGAVDMADPGCTDPLDSEHGANQCDDGRDNDDDGYIDYPDDSDCEGISGLSEIHPFHIGGIDTPNNAVGVYAEGGYAYVADDRSGLLIIDVSMPYAPVGPGVITPLAMPKMFLSAADWPTLRTQSPAS